MALNANGYFNALRSYLNQKDYGVHQANKDKVLLTEKIHQAQGIKPKKYELSLKVCGEVLVLKLDSHKKQLFHFLNDNAKPWSKKCDFVIFNLRKTQLFVYCLEFKSTTIPPDVPDQLKASVSWCQSLHSIINAYTGKKMRMNVMKFVVSEHDAKNSPYLDEDGYLQRDHTIRHYSYADIDGVPLVELENSNVEIIR